MRVHDSKRRKNLLGSYDHQAPGGTAAEPSVGHRGGGDLRVLLELQAPPNEATRKEAQWLLLNLVPAPGEVSPPGPSALAVRFPNSA